MTRRASVIPDEVIQRMEDHTNYVWEALGEAFEVAWAGAHPTVKEVIAAEYGLVPGDAECYGDIETACEILTLLGYRLVLGLQKVNMKESK